MTVSLDGKVALVTGGSRGIGLAIARDIVAHGGRVCLADRSRADLDEAVAQLGPESAIAIAGDAQHADHRLYAVQRTLAVFGSIEMLVTNTLTNVKQGRLVDADLKAIEDVVQLNVLTPLAWIQVVWDHWMHEHGGIILNVASAAASGPAPSVGGYAALKAALVDFTEQLAKDLAPDVRVNSAVPGVSSADFADVLHADREVEIAAGCPTERLGRPQDVAEAVRFLLDSGADEPITGHTLIIEGSLSPRGTG